MSWPSAMKVLAAVCAAPVLGEADAVAGAEAGVLGGADGVLGAEEADVATAVAVLDVADDAAELADELHAVTSKAAQPSAAHAATCLALCEFVVHMDFQPL